MSINGLRIVGCQRQSFVNEDIGAILFIAVSMECHKTKYSTFRINDATWLKTIRLYSKRSNMAKTHQPACENAPTCIRQLVNTIRPDIEERRLVRICVCMLMGFCRHNWRGVPVVKGKLLAMLSIQGQHGICVWWMEFRALFWAADMEREG